MVHHLNEAGGLQPQEDVWNNISTAQNALQAVSL